MKKLNLGQKVQINLPEGYEFKQEDICGYNGELCHVTCNHCASYPKKILRLVNCGTIAGEVPQPEPEESQMFTKSDLRDAFLAGYWLHLDSDNNDLASRKDKFENVFYKGLIQRKKQ